MLIGVTCWIGGTVLGICFGLYVAPSGHKQSYQTGHDDGFAKGWDEAEDAHIEEVGTLFEKIKHGDEAHQTWLAKAIDDHFYPTIE